MEPTQDQIAEEIQQLVEKINEYKTRLQKVSESARPYFNLAGSYFENFISRSKPIANKIKLEIEIRYLQAQLVWLKSLIRSKLEEVDQENDSQSQEGDQADEGPSAD